MLFEVGVLEFGVGVIRSLRFGSFFFVGDSVTNLGNHHTTYDTFLSIPPLPFSHPTSSRPRGNTLVTDY